MKLVLYFHLTSLSLSLSLTPKFRKTSTHPVILCSDIFPSLLSLSLAPGSWKGLKAEEGESQNIGFRRREEEYLVEGRRVYRMEGSTLKDIVQFGGSCLRASRRLAFAGVTFIFAVGGAIVGTISGALKGHTTETGLVHGAGIGAVAGALVSVDLLESLLHGEPMSKTAMFESLLDGKIFREWVSPATLKAYQWQVSTLESSESVSSDIFDTLESSDQYREPSDIFDTSSNQQGASPEVVRKLPRFEVSTFSTEPGMEIMSCAICLKDYENGENLQRLPSCRHFYHVACIERWLAASHSSCPICRQGV